MSEYYCSRCSATGPADQLVDGRICPACLYEPDGCARCGAVFDRKARDANGRCPACHWFLMRCAGLPQPPSPPDEPFVPPICCSWYGNGHGVTECPGCGGLVEEA